MRGVRPEPAGDDAMKDRLSLLLSSDYALRHLLPALLIAAATAAAGWYAGRLVRTLVRRLPHADEAVGRFSGGAVSWCVWLFGLVAALNALGVNTNGVLTAFGGLAIAVGLALKDTLGNVAAGLELVFLRPIAVGDFIAFRDPSDVRSMGTVTRIGLFSTELRTPDGLFLTVPNRLLRDEPIVDYDRNPERQIRLVFGVSYSDSLDAGLRALLELGTAEPRRLPDKPVEVFVDGLADSAVNLSLRVWVAKADYWPARRDLTKAGKAALEAAGLTIPFPQRDVHLVK